MRWILKLTGMVLPVVLCTTTVAAAPSETGGLPPWRFHMTLQEVKAFTDDGPYKTFRNGDLETYAGMFNGHKENVQFFFEDGTLERIGIARYEGQDIKAAAEVWGRHIGR